MTDKRKALFAKLRALLSKTVENGCTEAEALAALMVARRIMAEHDVAETDLSLGDEGVTFEQRQKSDRDKIRDALAMAVGRFCQCRAYSSGFETLTFAGLESDALFAHWLLDMLGDFVARSLREYLAKTWKRGTPTVRRLESAGFTSGCCIRINERLHELADDADKATPRGRGLVVVKHAMIDREMQARGIKLRDRWAKTGPQDNNAWYAGHERGDAAQFNKPIAKGATPRTIANEW